MDWTALSNQLCDTVSIFDIGCGKGHYGFLFKELLNKNINYSGLDIYKNEKFPDEFNHIIDRAENAHNHLKNHNLIVSQSALEHIEGDMDVLTNITQVLCDRGKPFVQIHLVPASASLYLYLWHGFRQYSEKNLGLISERLTSSYEVKVTIIPLGGWRSFITHFTQITLPYLYSMILGKEFINLSDVAETKTSKKCRSSVFSDSISSSRLPTFWGLVISSEDVDINAFL